MGDDNQLSSDPLATRSQSPVRVVRLRPSLAPELRGNFARSAPGDFEVHRELIDNQLVDLESTILPASWLGFDPPALSPAPSTAHQTCIGCQRNVRYWAPLWLRWCRGRKRSCRVCQLLLGIQAELGWIPEGGLREQHLYDDLRSLLSRLHQERSLMQGGPSRS